MIERRPYAPVRRCVCTYCKAKSPVGWMLITRPLTDEEVVVRTLAGNPILYLARHQVGHHDDPTKRYCEEPP